MPNLPSDRTARKHMPIGTGCLDYFPDALGAVAECSYVATQQHHPGSSMHWDKSKSTDEADCLIRHFLERGTVDSDGVRHSAKVAWRALALLQREIEAEVTTVYAKPGGLPEDTIGRQPCLCVSLVDCARAKGTLNKDRHYCVKPIFNERF